MFDGVCPSKQLVRGKKIELIHTQTKRKSIVKI